MAPNNKRKSVVSFNNLPLELQEAVKAAYPNGYLDDMIRVDKPNGDFFFAVTFETEEVSYLVKIDVKRLQTTRTTRSTTMTRLRAQTRFRMMKRRRSAVHLQSSSTTKIKK